MGLLGAQDVNVIDCGRPEEAGDTVTVGSVDAYWRTNTSENCWVPIDQALGETRQGSGAG